MSLGRLLLTNALVVTLMATACGGRNTTSQPVQTQPTDIARFSGDYVGKFQGHLAAAPVDAAVKFSVSSGSVTVTDPGQGYGTVDGAGSVQFTGTRKMGGMADVSCLFKGSLQPNAAGTWSCFGPQANSGNGTWSARRQAGQ